MQPPVHPPLISAKSVSSGLSSTATLMNGTTNVINIKLSKKPADESAASSTSVAVSPEMKIVVPAAPNNKATTLYSDLLESVTRWNAQANRQRRARMPYVDTVTGQPQRDNHLRQYRREARQKGGQRSGQLVTYPSPCRWRVEKRSYDYYYAVPASQLRATGGGSTDDASAEVDEMLAAYEDQQLYASLITTTGGHVRPSCPTTGPIVKDSVSSGAVAGVLGGVELKATFVGTSSVGGVTTRSSVTFHNSSSSTSGGLNGGDDTKSGSTSTSGNPHHMGSFSRAQRQHSQDTVGDEMTAAVLAASERSLMDSDDADELGTDSAAKDDEEDDDYHGGSRRRGSRMKRGGGGGTMQQSKVRRMAADRTYPCQECGKIFKSRQGLRYHMQSCPPDGSAAGAPIESVIISSAAGSVTTAATNRPPRRGNVQTQPPDPPAARHSTPHSSSSSQHSGGSIHNVMPAANQQQAPSIAASTSSATYRSLPLPHSHRLPQQQSLPQHIIPSHQQQPPPNLPPPAGAFGRPSMSAGALYPPQPPQQQYGSSSNSHSQHIPSGSGSNGYSGLYGQQSSHHHHPNYHHSQPPLGATNMSGVPPSSVPPAATVLSATIHRPPLNSYAQPQPPPSSSRPMPASSMPHQPLPPAPPHGVYTAGYPPPPSHGYLPPATAPQSLQPLSSAGYNNSSPYHHHQSHAAAPPHPPYHQTSPYGGNGGLPPPSSSHYAGHNSIDASLRPPPPPMPLNSALPSSHVNSNSQTSGIYPPPSLFNAAGAEERKAALLGAENAASASQSVSYAGSRSNGAVSDHYYNESNKPDGVLPPSTITAPLSSSSVFDDRHLAPPKTFCDVCKGTVHNNMQTGKPENMISCSQCRHSAHPTCLSFTDDMVNSIRTYDWQCIECKVCVKCGTSDNDDQLLFCDLCDRGYHLYCLKPPLKSPPEGKWYCELCQHRQSARPRHTANIPRQPQQYDGNIGNSIHNSSHP